jgi:hypothetical protein
VIWFRPPVKHRAWWDTEFSRRWEVTGLLARLWVEHFLPTPVPTYANDRDSLKW